MNERNAQTIVFLDSVFCKCLESSQKCKRVLEHHTVESVSRSVSISIRPSKVKQQKRLSSLTKYVSLLNRVQMTTKTFCCDSLCKDIGYVVIRSDML